MTHLYITIFTLFLLLSLTYSPIHSHNHHLSSPTILLPPTMGKALFKCDQCVKNYKHVGHLRNHVRKRHGEVPSPSSISDYRLNTNKPPLPPPNLDGDGTVEEEVYFEDETTFDLDDDVTDDDKVEDNDTAVT